ncbi:MAG: B12-binding domain-containing radical SAM protein [Candidatus Omnitrophica bacterium CG11_big_fil_rev_8_21_14_0_20_42_13]|uniref:B12-binding domain-containing radical SAM protein n=1 Tax=Candidatus Ghiorseimicrobium undicola TaxID=1974746 RepID=A0A2H0LZ10_9BACT|nr:MAG: B12-binding domain-containing radical SAM protein [Candidatus Omnitrophica bacterium CG11_big_fil_rev_8_21_14_0_20_42_13]
MNVLLVSPSQVQVYGNFARPDYPPLGLAYLGAVLEKAGHDVGIIDVDAERLTDEGFAKKITQGNYGLVGITATTPTFSKALVLAELVKKNSDSFTVLGGIHATTMPDESIENESIDFIVKGEGELTLLELVRRLQHREDLAGVDGIYYKKAGRIYKNKDRDLIADLDTLPFPARHLFSKHHYSYPDALFKEAFPIMTSRGCPANCSYCDARKIFSRKFRVRSAKNVVDEIEHLAKKYGAREIHIWDDNFTTQKNRVFQIRDEIKKRKLNIKFAFPNGIRADYVDKEVLRALGDMGAYSIAFGVESGNQGVLDHINKNTTLAKIETAFRCAKEAGLETWGFFMIGLPSETKDTINDTISFAISLNPDVAKFHILKPFPGTDAYGELSRQGLIIDNNLDHYGIHTPPVHRLPGLSPDDLLNLQKEAYKRFYLRPHIFLKQIFRLKSLYRLRLNVSAAVGILKKIFSR